MALLEIKNLNKKYMGGTQAITEFSLNSEGIVAVVGLEKAGKTTLLKCLAGLESCDGEILLNGKNLNTIEPQNRNIFMFFDDYALFLNRDVFYNLAYPLKIRGVSNDIIEKKVREAAESFSIRPLLFKKAKLLSDNEKRAVALARIILREADLYLLDDPLKGLYGTERKELFVALANIIKSLKGVVIYSTTEPDEALSLTDKIAVLNLGYLKQFGNMESLNYCPQNVLVAKLFSDVSIIEGRLIEVENILYAEFAGYRFQLSDDIKTRLISDSYIGKEVLFGIRVEDVIFSEDGLDVKVLSNSAKKGYYEVIFDFNGCVITAISLDKLQNNAKIRIDTSRIEIFDTVAEASILK